MDKDWNRLDRLRPIISGDYEVSHIDGFKEVLRWETSMQAFMVKTGGSEDCPILSTCQTVISWRESDD